MNDEVGSAGMIRVCAEHFLRERAGTVYVGMLRTAWLSPMSERA